jgi:hypothetical protein
MDGYKEDTRHGFWTLFLFSLLLLFIFTSSYGSGDDNASSLRSKSQHEFASGSISDHFKAVISYPARIPELQEYVACDLLSSGQNPSSVNERLSGYSQSITLNITQAHQTRLSIATVLLVRTCFQPGSAGDDEVPVLS